MNHGSRLTVTLGLGLAAMLLSGVTPGTAGTAHAQERPTEAEELRARADGLLARLPEIGRLRITRDLNAWASLDADARNRLERWIDLLLPMSTDALAQLLAPATAAAADARMQRVGQLLDEALVAWQPKPVGRASENRVVIVCVGGGYSSVLRTMSTSLATEKPVDALMPATVATVRPWGMLFTKFAAKINVSEYFLAMLLQGRSTPAIEGRSGSKALQMPSLGEMYRKHVGKAETARDVWMIYRGSDIVCDYSSHKAWGEKYYQIALFADRLQVRAKKPLEEERLEYRNEKKSPFDVSRHMHGMSAAKLNVDTMFTDRTVQEFIRRQVSHATGPGVNSDVFVARSTAELLRSTIDPRIVIARLGAPTPGLDGRVSNQQRDAFVRDTDRHIASIWAASRASDRWRGRTYFWLIVENSTVAFVSGPGIPAGSRTGSAAKLTQVVPTVARMLGLDPVAMVAGAKGASKKPIEELFPKPGDGGK